MKIAKHSSEEFQEVSKVSCKSSNAKIHAVPMKKSQSCSYFDGQITMPGLAAPAPFWLLHDLFHTLIASWSDQLHMASSLGTRPQKLHPRN